MRIELNLPSGARVRQFLDQLNAALRAISTGASYGQAAFDDEGNFRASTNGVFTLSGREVLVEWSVVRDRSGALVAIEVAGGSEITDSNWESDARRLVTDALAATIADRQKTFFRRVAFNYIGPVLDGEYWLPGFRFGPLLPDDEGPSLVNAERIVALDMNVNAVDDMHASALARENGLRYAARLSLLADLALYSTTPEMRWTMRVTGTGTIESDRLSLGFGKPLPVVAEMPKKGELCKLGSYAAMLAERYRFAGRPISLPSETRRVLRGIEAAAPEVTDAFDRCSRLYQVGLVCGRLYRSVGLAYQVAAVEAIAQTARPSASFAQFIRDNVKHAQDLEGVIDYLYGRARSAHFHGGEFPGGEFERYPFFDPLMDAEDVARSDITRRGYEVVREAIVTWISRFMPKVESDTPV